MSTLDSILSGGGEAVSDQVQTENEQVTQAATEGASQTEQQTESQETDSEGNRVPVAALQAERQKVKRYTEEVADFRKSNEALQRQVAELMQRIPVPKQEQPEPTDFFADPDKAMNERLQNHLGQAIGPVQAQLMAQAEMLAGIKYGDDKVKEAEQAFMAAANARTLDPADYQRVASSPNRYAAAVQWHQSQLAKAEIGDDPAAYKARLREELKAEVLAEINGGQQQPAQQRPAAVMPTNLAAARNVGSRSGPAFAGPQSIFDLLGNR
jgi:hypothetical protein